MALSVHYELWTQWRTPVPVLNGFQVIVLSQLQATALSALTVLTTSSSTVRGLFPSLFCFSERFGPEEGRTCPEPLNLCPEAKPSQGGSESSRKSFSLCSNSLKASSLEVSISVTYNFSPWVRSPVHNQHKQLWRCSVCECQGQ